MARNPLRIYDNTDLSIDQAESRGFLHRDYVAHCLRWSHVVKTLMRNHAFRDANILDIGCGKDLPLPRLMYANKMTGFDYSGVDINPLEFHPTLATAHTNGKARIALHEGCDASLLTVDDLSWGQPNVVVAFEIFEHIAPFIARRMLINIRNLMTDDGVVFISTPVYNGSAADNHISEWSRETLITAFQFHGFKIVANYGTFASQTELEPLLSPEHRDAYSRLKSYYDSNVLSCLFAPLYPAGARNNMWVLKKNLAPAGENTINMGFDQNVLAGEIITGAPTGE